MKISVNKRIVFLFYIIIFLFAGWSIPIKAEEWFARVRFVPDGDTFVDVKGTVYRLKGIDAPEVSHDKKPAQFYAYKSKALLKKLIYGKNVKVVVIGEKRDRYNRVLAYVYSQKDMFINRYMLEKGAAFCFPHFFQKKKFVYEFLLAQRKAIERQDGFWSYILSLPAADRKYVGNKKSKRFHSLSCPFGKKIRPTNKIIFINLKDAFWHGYAPCRRCTFWPLINKN